MFVYSSISMELKRLNFLNFSKFDEVAIDGIVQPDCYWPDVRTATIRCLKGKYFAFFCYAFILFSFKLYF